MPRCNNNNNNNMAYLTVAEMKTYLYEENVDVITRGDDTLVESAIDTAIAEAKGYLSGYNKTTIFATTGSTRNALLLTMVKDCAAWHIMKLSNAGIHYEYRKQVYERAITWLEMVQKGDILPDLPEVEDDDGVPTRNVIRYGSNDKRSQHY